MPNPTSAADVVERFLAALGKGDAAAIAALFADTIDWRVGGNIALPWTGTRGRRSDVPAYFASMWPHFVPGKSSSTVDQVIVAGDDAVIFGAFRHTARETGIAFETPVALHLVVIMGYIVKLHLYEDTWVVSNAFFPPASPQAAPPI
jgi:ketosteroid isomerase-like protein